MATEKTVKNRFAILNEINVNDHVEKKNGLTYLSWAWAWQVFKTNFPDSYYTVYENEHGWNYFTDGKTCWVKTGVTLVDGDYHLELIEYLPIMDFRNASISVDKLTSFDVNKSIQRSLTKAIARHGLGCYIYAGEDIPNESDETKQRKQETESQISLLLMQIQPLMDKIASGMSKEEKIAFANTHIVPYTSNMNYKACKDVEKLQKFYDHLVEYNGGK